MTQKKLNFLADFPAISTQEWMDKITADLKGADFSKKLVWRTPEGFNVNPFYRAEDIEGLLTTKSAPGEFPYVRGTKTDNNWKIRQNIDAKCAKAANEKALDILGKGINSLGIKVNKAELSEEYIATLLNGIDATKVELNFKVCVKEAAKLASLLKAYFASKGYDLSQVYGSICCDPINRMLLKGKKLSAEEITKILIEVLQESEALVNFPVIGVNAVSFNNAGVYCAQELGYALAWGNQYLELLTEAGVDPMVAKSIKFAFGVGGTYFMELA